MYSRILVSRRNFNHINSKQRRVKHIYFVAVTRIYIIEISTYVRNSSWPRFIMKVGVHWFKHFKASSSHFHAARF